MKKAVFMLAVFVVLAKLFTWIAFGGTEKVSSSSHSLWVKKYYSSSNTSQGLAVETDGRFFTMSERNSGVIAEGDYKESGNKVIMSSNDGKNETYVFDKTGDNLHFNPYESSPNARNSIAENTVLGW